MLTLLPLTLTLAGAASLSALGQRPSELGTQLDRVRWVQLRGLGTCRTTTGSMAVSSSTEMRQLWVRALDPMPTAVWPKKTVEWGQ